MNLIKINNPYNKIFNEGENPIFFFNDHLSKTYPLEQNHQCLVTYQLVKQHGHGHSEQGGVKKILQTILLTFLYSSSLKK